MSSDRRWPALRARVPIEMLASAIAVVLLVVLIATPAAGDGLRLVDSALRGGHEPAGQAAMSNAMPIAGSTAVGALFTTTATGGLGTHFCSASVIDSPAGDLVLTAAHCMAGRSAGQFVFVPDYHNGAAPYGVWAVSRVITDQNWDTSADPDDDFAFLQVRKPGSALAVEQVTGGERLGIGAPSAQVVTVIGYPDSGSSAILCVHGTTAFSPTQLEFDCGGFTTGTSGSPLLADLNPATGLGAVVGVIGGYQQGGYTASVSYAADFGQSFTALYQLASSEF